MQAGQAERAGNRGEAEAAEGHLLSVLVDRRPNVQSERQLVQLPAGQRSVGDRRAVSPGVGQVVPRRGQLHRAQDLSSSLGNPRILPAIQAGRTDQSPGTHEAMRTQWRKQAGISRIGRFHPREK